MSEDDSKRNILIAANALAEINRELQERNVKLERVAEAARINPRNSLSGGHSHHGVSAGFCELCAALADLERD